MAWPCAAVFRLSSPLVAHSAHAWPFAVATATQFRRFKRSRLAGIGAPSSSSGSDHSTATEEPAQSVTLPPTSPHAIVWCGDTPVVHRPLDDRCERHKRASRAWSACWPASPKGRIESEPRGPSQLRGVRGVSTNHTVPITNRHDSSWFESFRSHFALFWSFWLAISEPGWTSRKKVPLGIRLKSTRPSHGRFFSSLNPPEAIQKNRLAGLWESPLPDSGPGRHAPPQPTTASQK